MENDKDLVLFEKYVKENYDMNNVLILEKYVHTLMVVKTMMMICRKEGLTNDDTKLALQIALFHDLGRFREVERQHIFRNTTFDHGAYSNKILFNDGFIKNFMINEDDYLLIKKAIYYHNKKDLSDDLTKREYLFATLLRDADRIDILRVLSYKKNCFDGISDYKLIKQFNYNESIDIKDLHTKGDRVLLRLSFIKLFGFSSSFEVLEETGNLNKYLASVEVDEKYRDLFEELTLEVARDVKERRRKVYVR